MPFPTRPRGETETVQLIRGFYDGQQVRLSKGCKKTAIFSVGGVTGYYERQPIVWGERPMPQLEWREL